MSKAQVVTTGMSPTHTDILALETLFLTIYYCMNLMHSLTYTLDKIDRRIVRSPKICGPKCGQASTRPTLSAYADGYTMQANAQKHVTVKRQVRLPSFHSCAMTSRSLPTQ